MTHRSSIFPFRLAGPFLKLPAGHSRLTARQIVTLCFFLLLPTPFSLANTAQAQNAVASEDKDAEEKAADKAEFKQWIKYYTRIAKSYNFRLADESNAKLTVSPNPLMTYAYPSEEGGDTHGAFYVWNRLGRPELIGAMWTYGREGQPRTVSHEFHSLSTGRLEPVQAGRLTWRPKEGIELKPIPGAASPKKSAGLRLAQCAP